MKEEEERRDACRPPREVSARRVAPRPHQTSVHKQTKVAVSHPSLPPSPPNSVHRRSRAIPAHKLHPPARAPNCSVRRHRIDPRAQHQFSLCRRTWRAREAAGKVRVPRLYPPTQVRPRFTIVLLHFAHSVMRVLHRHRRHRRRPARGRTAPGYSHVLLSSFFIADSSFAATAAQSDHNTTI